MHRALPGHCCRATVLRLEISLVLLGVSLPPLAGCVTSKPSIVGADESVPPQAQHAVHGDELVRVMTRIDRLRFQRWPQELESDYASERAARTEKAFEQAARCASELGEAAGQIADVVQGVDVAEADRRGFLAQVGVLEAQVKQLETDVRRRDADAMRQALRQIDTTCRSCHARFRDVAGPID